MKYKQVMVLFVGFLFTREYRGPPYQLGEDKNSEPGIS